MVAGVVRMWCSKRRLLAGLALAVVTTAVSACSSGVPDHLMAGCERDDLDGRSVARVWDETLLELIREVVPAPTVHARNLFHTSAAMWDAWAAYDPVADGYFVTEKHEADELTAAREAAMSFAAYRLLLWRYATVSDLGTAIVTLDEVMASLCYRTDYEATAGDEPAALGNRIAATIIEFGASDGSNEDERYVDHTYLPSNPPLVVAEPGAIMDDPNAWQPLSLGLQVSQNGLVLPGNVQTFIGSQWGHVTSFALDPSLEGKPIDVGPPPRLGDPSTDEAFKQAAVDVLGYSSGLDPADGVMIDISPGSLGANTLGANDGVGHDSNPSTGEPYEPNPVRQGDYHRILAEYWADGPDSETPPGHWNLIANAVSDAPGFERRFGGTGPELDPLEWDVKTYFVLNGALHDAAISAWGVKAFYDSVRPISMIRYMGGLGQSSDPTGPAYHPDGLPLASGLVEVVTSESSGPGGRHQTLSDHVGEVAVLAWQGSPDDPETEVSGVGWVRAVEWVPYQRPSFVSPAFAGYISGHSTFSRAGAEILTALTGDPYFPGGLATWTVEAGALLHEEGPTETVTLQWATYADAADQAGISRLHGGIHILEDDVEGRLAGVICGAGAWELAGSHFDGSAQP